MTESRVVLYRIRKGAWGVWIKLTARAEPGNEAGLEWSPVGEHGRLSVREKVVDRIGQAGVEQLVKGVEVATRRAEMGPRKLSILVEDVLFPESDFQMEGLAAAIYMWIKTECDLSIPDLKVDFDKARNRYVFELG